MKTFCFNLLGLNTHTQRKPTGRFGEDLFFRRLFFWFTLVFGPKTHWSFGGDIFFLVFTNFTNRGVTSWRVRHTYRVTPRTPALDVTIFSNASDYSTPKEFTELTISDSLRPRKTSSFKKISQGWASRWQTPCPIWPVRDLNLRPPTWETNALLLDKRSPKLEVWGSIRGPVKLDTDFANVSLSLRHFFEGSCAPAGAITQRCDPQTCYKLQRNTGSITLKKTLK